MAVVILDNLPFADEDITDDARNASLGRFMTAWAQIEVVCGFLFREMAGIERERAQIIFDRVGNREQITIIKELSELLHESALADALAADMERVDKLAEKRNKIAHARWGSFNLEPSRFWSGLTSANIADITNETPKGKSLRLKNIHSMSDIEKLAKDALDTREQLESYLGKVGRVTRDEYEEMLFNYRNCRIENSQLHRQLGEQSWRISVLERALQAIDPQHPEVLLSPPPTSPQ